MIAGHDTSNLAAAHRTPLLFALIAIGRSIYCSQELSNSEDVFCSLDEGLYTHAGKKGTLSR